MTSDQRDVPPVTRTPAPPLRGVMMTDEISADEYNALMATSKRSKYHNIPAERGPVRFHSQAEARRYDDLLAFEQGGLIRDLELQPRYPLKIRDIYITTYVADFRYWDVEKGCEVVEDVKGVSTREYRIKKKLVKALYGVTIREIRVHGR